MPVLDRNYNNTARGINNTARYGGGVNTIKPHEEEQRIANAVLQEKISLKDTPLSRMTGLKTTVIYFNQKAVGRNDYLINTANINSIDTNKRNFIKIKDFIILCNGESSYQAQNTEMSIDVNMDGEAKILPKTIKPMIDDYFIMSVGDKNHLFRITNVTKTTVETDSAYNITYSLTDDVSGERLDEIEKCVTEIRVFVYGHVGTSFRTIFREEEYVTLLKLDTMYNRMAELYNEFFYNKDKNTYLLTYDTLTIKDESGNPINESRMTERPYVIAVDNPVNNSTELMDKPILDNSDVWYGSLMYDRMLIEFITKTGIFSRVGRKIFRVTQLQEDLERWYSKTIFYAVEHRTTKRLRFKYLVPSPITRVTIASTLNLYGTVSLEPSLEYLQSSLQLYPKPLIPYMMWETKEREVGDISLTVYNDMIELMCETIGLYVNRKPDDCIIERLMLMEQHLEEFYELSIQDQNMFYLFPILSLVVRSMMDSLSDDNFGNSAIPMNVPSK